MTLKGIVTHGNSKLVLSRHVSGSLTAGEESGASLFKRELEAEVTTERDEQVLSQY